MDNRGALKIEGGVMMKSMVRLRGIAYFVMVLE